MTRRVTLSPERPGRTALHCEAKAHPRTGGGHHIGEGTARTCMRTITLPLGPPQVAWEGCPPAQNGAEGRASLGLARV